MGWNYFYFYFYFNFNFNFLFSPILFAGEEIWLLQQRIRRKHQH
jgi:hypothetical protein